jgi:general secretion pathway protein I
MSRARPRQGGFTLIEVLVALAILSIAVVASIQGFAQGLRLLTLAGEHQKAALLADEKLREVVDVTEGEESGTEGPLRWQRVTRAREGAELLAAEGTPRGRVYEIGVRVSWAPSRVVEIHTLRTVLPTSENTQIIPPGQQPTLTPTTQSTGTRSTGTRSTTPQATPFPFMSPR